MPPPWWLIQKMKDVDWVISTHQTEDLAMRGSEISVLDEGRLVWQGAPTDFLDLGEGESAEGKAVAAYRSLVGEEL